MITFDNNNLDIPVQGGLIYSEYVSLNPITNPQVHTDMSWINVEIESREVESGILRINIEPNSGKYRTGVITVTAYDTVIHQNISADLYVRQAEQTVIGILEIASAKLDDETTTLHTINSDAHTLTLYLRTSNIGQINLSGTTEWVQLRSQTGTDTVQVVFNISNNTSITQQRSTTLVFTATDFNNNQLQANWSLIQKATETHPANVQFSEAPIYFESQGGYTDIEIYLTNVQDIRVVGAPDWLEYSLDEMDPSLYMLSMNASINSDLINRVDKIVFDTTSVDGNEDTWYLDISQARYIPEIEIPAWEDYYVPITNIYGEDKTKYSISINNKVIYEGINYDNEEINVTPIIQSYIEDNLEINLLETLQHTNYITAVITGSPIITDNSITPFSICTFRIYLDYSYNKITDTPVNRNMLIDNELDARQYLFVSHLNKIGDRMNVTIGDVHQDIHLITSEPGIHQYILPLWASYEGRDEEKYIDIQHHVGEEPLHYPLKLTCAKYAIYYANSLGGWDSLLIKGKVVETHTNDIASIKLEYDNRTNAFGTKHYLKDRKTTYKMTTGYLTDAQSSLMYNLLDTTKAYLHNLETGELIPVVINNKSYDVKTYYNQNRKLYTYTIEVEESQQKYRR